MDKNKEQKIREKIAEYIIEMTAQSLGAMIRAQRKAQGLTEEKLARKIGINRGYLSKIEGRGLLPSPDVYKKIKMALGLGSDFQSLYIKNKYSNFGEVLKKVVEEDKAKPKTYYFAKGQESFVKALKDKAPATYNALTAPIGSINAEKLLKELSGRVDTYPIAVKVVKQYYPSYVNDKVFINKMSDGLKKLKKKIEDYQGNVQDALKNLLPNPA